MYYLKLRMQCLIYYSFLRFEKENNKHKIIKKLLQTATITVQQRVAEIHGKT